MAKKLAVILFVVLLVQHGWLEVRSSKNTCANGFTPLTEPESPPNGMFSVKKPPASFGLKGAVGDGITDDTSSIQAIINQARKSTRHKKIFFPPGEYVISSDLYTPPKVELHGSENYVSVIKATTPFKFKITNSPKRHVQSVKLENLFLDGIRVRYWSTNSRDVNITKCVFFSSGKSIVAATHAKEAQLSLLHLTNARISNCVFLRDRKAFGVGSQFYKTIGAIVSGNIFGLDLSCIDWLTSELKGTYWQDQKRKLRFLKSHYKLLNDQGYFVSSLYDGYDKKITITRNVFNGSPHSNNLWKDHAIYLKGFTDALVTYNYARGWLADPSGGFKARNGRNLLMARNYLDDVGILLYIHQPDRRELYPALKNVTIYGNHLVERTNFNKWATGICYYEPHWRTFSGSDESLQYAANVFEFPGATKVTRYSCIDLTNGNVSQHKVYRDNVYYGTTTPVTVKARWSTPSFEKGHIDVSISSQFSEGPYKLNIPTYT